MARTNIDRALGNIQRVIPIDLQEDGDYEDNENGFFIRAESTGYIKYCPVNNSDAEFIIKEFTASTIFVDPEICRKIFATGQGSPAATGIYIGYGV